MKRDPEALMGREHDVLVIGGGIAGAWTAWEAASRGLRAALIEAEDFGQATSWSSLKTAHGGLRHLQRLDVAGFRESVRERRALLQVAPEVVRPLSFAVPASGVVDRAKYFLGGVANDVLSFDRNAGLRADRTIGPSRLSSAAEAARTLGGSFANVGAFLWQDAQITHTERLLLALLHSATNASALTINRCRLDSVSRRPDGFTIAARDTFADRDLTLNARSIVNATGARLESVARLMGHSCGNPRMIRGVNVVLSRDVTAGIAIGDKDRGRFLFLVPWLGQSILGTTYDDGTPPLESLVMDLVEAGKRTFPWAGIDRDAVVAIHAGHVPGGSNDEPIYRSRIVPHDDPRILSILTAKYTTARATAEHAIDAIGGALGLSLPASTSARTELVTARPLVGDLNERLRFAMGEEMALSPDEAWRGRLAEGAKGAIRDPKASGA